MILDKILLSKINIIGDKLLKKSGLNTPPTNIQEMKFFLETIKQSINESEFEGVLIANILFSFISDIEIRNRLTTSRIFEDVFGALFNETSSDILTRTNPTSPSEIEYLDKLCEKEQWYISSDISTNKREKSDLSIGDYEISLKTLKGKAYGENNTIIDNDYNRELNVGSLSFRALLKGILEDTELNLLSDRRSGLGSGTQLRKHVFNPILNHSKEQEFLDRLTLFLNYVYEEDMYIVLKSHFRIDFILIPNSSFVNSLIYTYKYCESDFEKIFYRWENNNLRLVWPNMIKAMDKFDLPYFKNYQLNEFKIQLSEKIEDSLRTYMDN